MKTLIKQIVNAFFASILTLMTSCNSKTPVDLIVHNANIYTVDNDFSKAQAFAVKNGKFVAVGDEETIMSQYIALSIDDLGGDVLVHDGFLIADGDKLSAFHGKGLGFGEIVIDSVDVGVVDNEVHRCFCGAGSHKGQN